MARLGVVEATCEIAEARLGVVEATCEIVEARLAVGMVPIQARRASEWIGVIRTLAGASCWNPSRTKTSRPTRRRSPPTPPTPAPQ